MSPEIVLVSSITIVISRMLVGVLTLNSMPLLFFPSSRAAQIGAFPASRLGKDCAPHVLYTRFASRAFRHGEGFGAFLAPWQGKDWASHVLLTHSAFRAFGHGKDFVLSAPFAAVKAFRAFRRGKDWVSRSAFRAIGHGKDFAAGVTQWVLSIERAAGLIPDKRSYLAY